jgi:predicted permease
MFRIVLKLLRRRRLERDLEVEMAFHREMAAQHGNTIPFGNPLVVKEQARDLWRFASVENVWRDLRYAARGLRRSPGLVISALLSLGVGIGVNMAIFSMVTDVLFSTPSITEPDRWMGIRLGGSSHASPDVVEALRASGVFAAVAGEREESSLNWDDGSETRPLHAVDTTPDYFAVLGIPMGRGRGYGTSDPRDVVVVSHRFWRDHLGSNPDVVGGVLRLDGRAYTVTGVLPPRHRTLIGMGFSPDLYVPRFRPDAKLAIYVKVAPGTTPEAARARAEAAAAGIDRVLPQPAPLAQHVEATPVSGMDRLRSRNSQVLVLFSAVLMGAVGLVLLIACVNVAGLLLARAAGRRQEMAMRLALGASRARLLQQLFVESLLLAGLGVVSGLVLRQMLAWALERVSLPLPVPVRFQLGLDLRAILYAGLLMLVASCVAGLLPAWQAVRETLAASVKRGGRIRVRRVLVVAQVATAFVVLATSGLFLRNVRASSRISPGFETGRAVRADVHLPPARYLNDPDRSRTFVDETLAALDALPGVDAAATLFVPLQGSTRRNTVAVRFLDAADDVQLRVYVNAVTRDYFRTLDIPFLAGRSFDGSSDASAKAVIVNRTWADRASPGRDVVGRAFRLDDEPIPYRVIGVVEGTKNRTLGEDPEPQYYEDLRASGIERSRIQFLVRGNGSPQQLIEAVRQVLRAGEPAAGLVVEPLTQSVALAMLPSQVGATLLGIVGALGLGLAAVGLYGVMAYAVTRRTREIGIRLAIGASRGTIARLVIREAAWMVGIGALIGLALALLLTRPLATFLVPGLTPADPISYAGVLVVLLATGLAATAGPVLRALRVPPMESLRAE